MIDTRTNFIASAGSQSPRRFRLRRPCHSFSRGNGKAQGMNPPQKLVWCMVDKKNYSAGHRL